MMSSFLLLSLNTNAIPIEQALHQKRELDEITKVEGLSDAYAVTLLRMKKQQRSRSKPGMQVVMWVPHPERPFPTEAMLVMGIEEGFTNPNTLNIHVMGHC